MILSNISQAEKALRSLSLNHAKGKDMDALSRYYGYKNPRILPDEYWGECIKILAYSAKGTPGSVFAFCEAFFDWWSQHITYETTLLGRRILDPTGSTFNCAYTNRFVRVYYEQADGSYKESKSSICWTGDLDPVAGLKLADVKTGYFDFASKSTVNVKVKFLPFFIREQTPGLVEVLVDTEVFLTPAHYLLNDASTPRGSLGFNTYLMDFFGLTPDERFANVREGQYGIYLSGEALGGEFSYLIEQLLASGLRAKITAHKWCDADLGLNSITNARIRGRAAGNVEWPGIAPYDDVPGRENNSYAYSEGGGEFIYEPPEVP